MIKDLFISNNLIINQLLLKIYNFYRLDKEIFCYDLLVSFPISSRVIVDQSSLFHLLYHSLLIPEFVSLMEHWRRLLQMRQHVAYVLAFMNSSASNYPIHRPFQFLYYPLPIHLKSPFQKFKSDYQLYDHYLLSFHCDYVLISILFKPKYWSYFSQSQIHFCLITQNLLSINHVDSNYQLSLADSKYLWSNLKMNLDLPWFIYYL